MKKKFIAIAAAAMIACFGAFALTACGGGSSNNGGAASGGEFDNLDPVVLVAADSASKGSVGNLWPLAVAEKVSALTDGKLTIDYHGAGELGGDVDVAVQVQNNDVQIFTTQPAPLVAAIPELACFDLPMAFANADGDTIDAALNGENEFTTELQAAYEKAGFHNLGFCQNATFRQTTSNKELRTLADFKGFQIRTMENPNHMAFWSAVGAEPTPMAWAEVYFALQNGTVDGQENAADTCTGASLQEVQKYLCMTNHILYSYNMSISKECWDSLDPVYQAALVQAVNEAKEEIRAQIASLNADNIKVMEDAGMEVISYDEQFFNDFVNNEGVQKVYANISKATNGLSDKMLAQL